MFGGIERRGVWRRKKRGQGKVLGGGNESEGERKGKLS